MKGEGLNDRNWAGRRRPEGKKRKLRLEPGNALQCLPTHLGVPEVAWHLLLLRPAGRRRKEGRQDLREREGSLSVCTLKWAWLLVLREYFLALQAMKNSAHFEEEG